MTKRDIDIALASHGKRHKDLMCEINEKYHEGLCASSLSAIIAGRTGNGVKTKRVMREIELIIDGWKASAS